jgi:hypothetical protein
VSEPAWKSKPIWYLVAADDHMIPPPAQRSCPSARVQPSWKRWQSCGVCVQAPSRRGPHRAGRLEGAGRGSVSLSGGAARRGAGLNAAAQSSFQTVGSSARCSPQVQRPQRMLR